MRRLLILVLCAACASSALAAQTKKPSEKAKADPPGLLAPADEYFGRMKMSPIGIGNEIRDLGLLLRYNPERYEHYLGRARTIEEALLDWRTRYPRDTWLARDTYTMARVDAMFYDKRSHQNAWSLMTWVAAKFPKTSFGANAKGELRHGHIVPLYAMPKTPPTPRPPAMPAAPAATAEPPTAPPSG
ncbi:MAG: hypothetical protein KGM44_07995 [bacterium]|nr:hypothetical protein [bacterium]